MRRPARRGAAALAALSIAALVLGGCGAAHHIVRRSVVSLCLDIGLPRSGAGSALTPAITEGIETAIPRGGVDFDGYRVRVCTDGYVARGDSANQTAALLSNAVSAATDGRTVGYIGALSSTQATEADAVLAPAQIPLITPSAGGPASPPPTRRGGLGPGTPQRRTTFALLPAASSQTRAVQAYVSAHGCYDLNVPGVRTPKRGMYRCVVESSPFCSQAPALIYPEPNSVFCIFAGDAAAPPEPAVAYGYSAAEVLLGTLRRLAAAGGDIANRGVVLAGLARANLARSPIGPVRFDANGTIVTDRYSVYTVKTGNSFALAGTFSTH